MELEVFAELESEELGRGARGFPVAWAQLSKALDHSWLTEGGK